MCDFHSGFMWKKKPDCAFIVGGSVFIPKFIENRVFILGIIKKLIMPKINYFKNPIP